MLSGAIQQSTPGMLLAGLVAFILALGFAKLRQNSRIHKLGGRAPQLRSFTILWGLDIIWENVKYARQGKNLELWQRRFKNQQTHTIEMTILGQRFIFTDEPENIKAILAVQFPDFGKGEEFHKLWTPFLGDSIFTTDGSAWHSSRQLIRPQFLKDRISDLHTFERHMQHMLELIPKDGDVVDVKDLFYRFTLDSATDFLMGTSVNSLGSPQVKFALAFGECQKFMDSVSKMGPAQIIFPRWNFNKNLKILNEFVEPFVKRTIQMKPEELKEKTEKSYNFLHALTEFTTDERMLRDQLVAVLLAARDTTAATLSWAVYELSLQPKLVEKLRAEILDTVGPSTAPTYAHLKEMRFLQSIINETLRLYPPVPFNIRAALKDTYLPRGAGPNGLDPIGIPKDTPIVYSPLAMQRREDIFGPDVNKFDPERWSKWTPKSWQYIPFNGGPRICVGQQFALTEMAYSLVKMFQEFESVESRVTAKMWIQTEIVGAPGEAVLVSFKRAAK